MALLGQDTRVYGANEKPDELGSTLRFVLETFEGTENLALPYRYDVSLLSKDPNVSPSLVLGLPLTIRLKLDATHFRYFHGIVTQFAKGDITGEHTRYRAILNPLLSKLAYTRTCRIFNVTPAAPDGTSAESQTALTIVNQILDARGITDSDSSKLSQHVFRKREYCVQYRESELNFIQRLLEEEGIYYFFRHEDGKATLVLAESGLAHGKSASDDEEDAVVPYVPKRQRQLVGEHFWSLRVSGSLYPGQFKILRDYEYTELRLQPLGFGQAKTLAPQPGPKFEDYDYPGGLFPVGEAEGEAKIRAEAEFVANTLIEVEGNTMGLGVGDLVTIAQAPPALGDKGGSNPFWNVDDFKKQYLVTAATYTISIDQYETGQVAKSDEPFKAHYCLLDSTLPYRPRRGATKPRIDGPQTAIVVGGETKSTDAGQSPAKPSEDEIWTDALGRVKVQFHWDLLGSLDANSSCWVRVAQVWAGAKWGAFHMPRIGHEVIVEFLDGDPDRPIITGRIYNTNNKPPYDTPTQSGIKSRSTKKGTDQNFNEIRFEDLKGEEELHMQAERDMSTYVKRNQTTNVDGDRSVTVGGNQSTTVTGEEEQTYKDSRYMWVQGPNEDLIDGEHVGTYNTGRKQMVWKGDSLTVEQSDKETTVTGGAYRITVENEYNLTQGANVILLKEPDLIANNGKCNVTLSAGDATITATDSLTLKCGSASITLKNDGSIEIAGPTKVAIQGGGMVTATPAGVDITGAVVKVNS